MSIHSEQLIHKATFWQHALNRYGKRVLSPAQPTSCRWVDERKEVIDEEGHKHTSMAKVYVGVDLEEGDLLARGDCPRECDALVVKRVKRIANYTGTEVLKIVWLVNG